MSVLFPHIPIIRRGRVKPYNSLPSINWRHPLTRNLQVYCYDMGGVIVDLVTGNLSSPTGTKPLIAQTPVGAGTKFLNAGGSHSMPFNTRNKGTFSSPCTYGAMLYPTATPNTAVVVGYNTPTGSSNPFNFYTTGSATTIEYGWNNSTGAALTVPNMLNAAHSLLTVGSAATTNLNYYDGSLNSTTAISTSGSDTTDQLFFNCAGTLTGFNGYTGFVYYFAFWTRALSAAEALLLHTNPFGMLIYPEDEIVAALVGASGFILNPQQVFLM